LQYEILKETKEVNNDLTPLIFIHGAYHGAWCYRENFLPYFSEKGYPAYALSFRGHGNSEGHEKINVFTLNDYVEDVVMMMNHIEKKPILIGHSMGGAVVQKVLQSYSERVEGAVLMSSAPPNGIAGELIRGIFKNIKVPKHEREGQDKLFFSDDLDKDKRDRYIKELQPESNKVIKRLLRRIVPRSQKNSNIKLMVLGSTKDKCVSIKSVMDTAKFYGVEPVILDNVNHDMMLDTHWITAAEHINRFLISVNTKKVERIVDDYGTTRLISS